MKRRKCPIACAGVALVLVFSLGLTACGDFGTIKAGKNPYEVATEFGYDGDEATWLAEQTGGTQARRMYEEAVADGYLGSYVDFLKEIGFSGDDSAGVNAALTATVEINCTFTSPRTSGGFGFGFGSSSGGEKYTNAGSGVFYGVDLKEGDAYVVTNYHVVYSADSDGSEKIKNISDEIELYLYGDTLHSAPIDATYLGGSLTEDVAVLKVEDSEVLKTSSAHAVTAANSDALTVGERVYAIGDPDGAGLSVVAGIVSVDAEYIRVQAADGSTSNSLLEIRTDAPINHGNSGGGLYNADGCLVGIVNARLESTGVEAFGYAIPVNRAFAVAQNILDNSKTNNSQGALRAMLGITVESSETRSVYDEATGKVYLTEKVAVKTVNAGAAAEDLLQRGDVLYSVRIGDGTEKIITRRFMLENEMYNVRKGNTVTVVVNRGGETVTVQIPFLNDADFTQVK